MALKLAIVGRPNVGKSTLFNRLAGRRLAIVDDRPGVTRDRKFGTGRLGDLDLALAQAEVVLFVIDAREGVAPLDKVFGEVLRRVDKPVILVANKTEGRAG